MGFHGYACGIDTYSIDLVKDECDKNIFIRENKALWPYYVIMLYNVFSELSTFLQTMLSEEWVFMLSIFFSSFLLFLTGKLEKQRKIIIVIGFETF